MNGGENFFVCTYYNLTRHVDYQQQFKFFCFGVFEPQVIKQTPCIDMIK